MSKSKLFKIWLIGPFLQVGSDYVSDGDLDYQAKTAPFKFWFYSLCPPLVVSMILTSLLIYGDLVIDGNFIDKSKPADFFLGVIASLLGFGIGVYALVFSISSNLIAEIQSAHQNYNRDKNSKTSVLSINSDFAFPLMCLTLTLILLSFQLVFNELKILKIASFFYVFLSFSMTFKLIFKIYLFGKNLILEKHSSNLSKRTDSTNTTLS